jgi:hypothetical protein
MGIPKMKKPWIEIPRPSTELLLNSNNQILSQTGKNSWRNFRHLMSTNQEAFCPGQVRDVTPVSFIAH